MKPSQLARRRAQHVMLFGDAKTGKSTLAAKLLLDGFNLTWISMDNGHDVIFKLPLTIEQLDRQLNIIVIPDTHENPQAVSTCLKLVTGNPFNVCDAHGQIECPTCKSKKLPLTRVCLKELGARDIVVWDHIGQLANSVMRRVMEKKKDDDKPEWDDYFKQGFLMDRFLTNIQQAPYNTICITHTCETEMDDGKKRLVPLVGTTNFSRNVGKYFDHIIHCNVMNARHRFGSATTYANTILTGSRSDVVIEKLDEPSLLPFFDGTILPVEETGGKVMDTLLVASPVPVGSTDSVEVPTEFVAPSVPSVPVTTRKVTETAEPEPAKLSEAVSNAQSLLAKIRAAKAATT